MLLNKGLSLLRNGLSDELLSGSLIVFLGGTFSSFLAFILNIYFARNLSYSDYGVYVSLLSLFSLAVMPGQSLNAIIVRFATHFHSTNEREKYSAFYKKTFSLLSIYGIALLLLSIAISGQMSSFLRISDSKLIIFVALLVLANYLLTLNIGYLSSLLRFKEISLSYIISGIVKISAGIALVMFGFKVYGALGSILFLVGVQFIYTLIFLRKYIDFRVKNVELPIIDMFKYAVPTSVALFSLYSFVSLDVLLVKHFFSADEAGLYGGLSLVGKVIFYFTLPIPAVMFPLVVKRFAKKESYSKLLYMALLIVFVASSAITALYYLFPSLTLGIFLGGNEYLKVAPLLGLFGVFLTIYSLNNVFVTYFLSIRKMKVSIPVLIFAVTQVVLISLFHRTFAEVILISIAASVLLLSSLVLYYLISNFDARD